MDITKAGSADASPGVSMHWQPTGEALPLRRDSPFSHTCGQCGRCCSNVRIQVNPYEVVRLARHLGIGSMQFVGQHLRDGAYLASDDAGRCVFAGSRSCSVHAARPLVCRVYPLGIHISAQGEESFVHLEPHPQSAGRWGLEGTVDDHLSAQGAAPYLAAAERYAQAWAALSAWVAQAPVRADLPSPDWLDPDTLVAEFFPDPSAAGHGAGSAEDVMELHIQAIERWTHRQSQATHPQSPETA